MEFSVRQIADIIGGKVEGDEQVSIRNIGTLEDAVSGHISFLHNDKYEPQIYTTKASAVIVKEDFEAREELNTTLIRVNDPYSGLTILLKKYQELINYQKSGVEEPSFLGKNSTTGDGIYRGAFSHIGDNVKIGNNVKIYPHAYIGDNSELGDNCIIHSGVKIYPNTQIGNNCVIHSGSVIGSDGFGFAPQEDGTYESIPQVGNVIIEDNVDIGANTVIDCATFKSTIIEKGVKLDNLIQVAHNVVIGSNTVIAAQAGISGSSRLGKNVVVAGQAGIVGHLEIGDKVTVAAQSGVTKNLKDNTVVLGSPAFEIGDYRKSFVLFRKLPEIHRKLLDLEEKMLNLRTFEEDK